MKIMTSPTHKDPFFPNGSEPFPCCAEKNSCLEAGLPVAFGISFAFGSSVNALMSNINRIKFNNGGLKAMTENITPDTTLDCKGLSCPMPLLKAKKAIKGMTSGQIIEIFSTDPGTKNDLPGFAKKSGHEYLGDKEDEGFTRFYLKVK